MVAVVRTVLGDVSPESLGVTLLHEHLYMDARHMLSHHQYVASSDSHEFSLQDAAECRWNPGAHSANYDLTGVTEVVADLLLARDSGVRTVVDVTPIDMERSPTHLRSIARKTGLHVVMGTGYYLRASHARHLNPGHEEDEVFDRIVHEHEHGHQGVHPGIIGEIGTGEPPADSEIAVLRGAARAATATGLALSVHVHPWGWAATDLVGVIDEAGADASRVVLGHMNTAIDRIDYLHRLLAHGVTLGFDLFGFDHSLLQVGRYPPSERDVVRTIVELIRQGFGGQIIMSQDVGVRTRLQAHGGWGYSHLLEHVVPLLVDEGLDGAEIHRMLVDNPRALLTVGGSGIAAETVGR